MGHLMLQRDYKDVPLILTIARCVGHVWKWVTKTDDCIKTIAKNFSNVIRQRQPISLLNHCRTERTQNSLRRRLVFWNFTPRNLVEVYWHFGTCCLYHQTHWILKHTKSHSPQLSNASSFLLFQRAFNAYFNILSEASTEVTLKPSSNNIMESILEDTHQAEY